MNKKYKCINSFILKMIAIITMVIDHVGAVLFPMNMMFRYIGRISFPLFVFLLVEGSIHTRKIRKYELRMFLFALISEIPFDLAFSNEIVNIHSQNVFWTLGIGLVMLDLIQNGAFYILLIYLVWMTHENVPAQAVSFAVIAILFFGVVELPGVIAFLPILLYNGKKGPSAKYIFYAFYPVHLFLLHLIQASTFFIVR